MNCNRPYEGILICSDFDGTLSFGGEIPQRNIDAILDFCSKGGLFTVSSGRDHHFLEKKAGGLFNAPLICVNGTRIYDAKNGKVLFSQTMDEQALSTIKTYMPSSCTGVEVILEGEHSRGFFSPKEFDIGVCEGKPISKIVTMYASVEDAILARDELSRLFPQYVFDRSFSVGVEQISPLAGKGKCVHILKELLGVKTTVGVGDFENDLSMLLTVDISFAPENAIPKVKEAVDYVVCTDKEGALAEVIRKLAQILQPNS